MKKIINLLSVAVFISLASCGNEPPKKTTEKQVIVVPETKTEETPPTSVTVDKKGVEVESKKVNVKVQPGN